VKDLSSRWAVAILLAPVLLILGLALLGNSDPASAAKTPANKAVVAIAFVSSFGKSPSAASFQRVTLNVVSVRLNPSTDPNVSVFDSRWVTIGVPAGVGRSVGVSQVSTGTNFGGNFGGGSGSVSIGEGRSEIQIDLNAIQNVAEIFNAQAVVAKTYHQIELVLDPGTPGNVVPLCPQLFPAGEGCIDYKAKFIPITPSPVLPQTIRTSATLELSKNKNFVTPLVIQIEPGLQAPPASFNDNVLISPTISMVGNSVNISPFLNPQLATLDGTVKTNAPHGFSNQRPVSITARLVGTDNIVETEELPKDCAGKTSCDFTMYLPAARPIATMTPGFPGGTDYDLVASGKANTYAVRGNVHVFSGPSTPPFMLATPLEVKNKGTTPFSGKALDKCGAGVSAATLDLLVPDATLSPVPDCSVLPRPAQCVVAASAATDEAGNFPLPGNGFNTAPFNQVPLPDAAAPYELMTTAAGFDRTLVKVTTNTGNFKCTPTAKNGTCNVNLSHGVMTGNISLGGGGTGPAVVLVAAEDSGTNNVENLTLVTIPAGLTTVPFTMNVPDVANTDSSGTPVMNLDLFASTQDLFNGAPQKATGHTIAVEANVGAPGTPIAVACQTVSPPDDLEAMTCVGHGSVAGTVTNPGTMDTVVLSKADGANQVQIESVPVVPPGSSFAGDYALCAPADPLPYTLTHYRHATPFPTPAGSIPVTLNTPVILPTPSPSATPCPGICNLPSNTTGGCQVCSATSAVGP
jgi:hypothetical protein